MAVAKAKWPQVSEMRASGMQTAEIARALGCSRQAVHETLQVPEVIEAIEAIHAEAREAVKHKLQAAATLGLSVLVELAKGRPNEEGKLGVNDMVRRQAASDLLDRCGVTKETAVRLEGQAGPTVVVDVSKLSLDELLTAANGDEDTSPQ